MEVSTVVLHQSSHQLYMIDSLLALECQMPLHFLPRQKFFRNYCKASKFFQRENNFINLGT